MFKRIVPIVVLFALAGCTTPTVYPTAEIEVVHWEQAYYESIDQYSWTYIEYAITNTSPVAINYYDVYFEITCRGGAVFQQWANGVHINPGKAINSQIIADTSGHEVVDVDVSDYALYCSY